MGVPKFYRWISERYPCLSEVVKEFQLPEFDNLYLDMNGIIHVCSHPDDDNPHFRIKEEDIFRNICHYIDFLYRMIKPKKVFFMAVDGVAPRAKMNQQRGRRFRSAKEAELSIKKAEERGETLPTEQRFDSNCITPGTPFMVRLQTHLKYFVIEKVSNDPLWQGRKIYLSGHETPGEGEHKVMDYIRYSKSQAEYDPNTRHCLYGLDADLIMLGLLSHEPRFSLLREEVRFGGKRDKNKRPMTPEETTFHLLHLSLLRDYLGYEFAELKGKLSFEWDLEKLLDDWILMGFLVGNDFIPHLPHLHINHDALPLLWKTYKTVLPTLDGYMNEAGHLNLHRFEKFMIELSKFDLETFESAFSDLSYLESKLGGKSINESAGPSSRSKPKMKELKPFKVKENGNSFAALEDLTTDNGALGDASSNSDEDEDDNEFLSADEEAEDEDEEEDCNTFDDEFRLHKRDYYMSKLAFTVVNSEVIKEQAHGYVTAIQWILLYYYEGCPSWSWFFAHHYAPYISDIRGFSDMKITFDLSTPFLPFQQLMAVLPAASKELLPPGLQPLMTEASSSVLDFYPLNFETDLNGKQQDWEAVVLIPFIDERRLLEAMASREHLLTSEEKARNRHGPHLLYQWTTENQGFHPSSVPGVFPDIHINKAKLTEIDKHTFHIDSKRLRKGILEGTRLDMYIPGFPTLHFLPHTFGLSRTGVKVFQQNSRGENMVLRVKAQEGLRLEEVADELLGKETFVGWPHLHEARVTAVSDGTYRIELIEELGRKGKKELVPSFNRRKLTDTEASIVVREADSIKERHMDRFAIEVGKTEIIVYASPMTGRLYAFDRDGAISLNKQFASRETPFVHQMTVKNVLVQQATETTLKTLEEVFPEDSPVFMLGNPHYGTQGKVLEVLSPLNRVRVVLDVTEEIDFSYKLETIDQDDYVSNVVAAQQVGMDGALMSRITGSIFVERSGHQGGRDGKVNIGLNLKFTKRMEEVPGYTKKKERGWCYSRKCVRQVEDYVNNFRDLWFAVQTNRDERDMFSEDKLFPEGCPKTLADVQEYLEKLPCTKAPRMPFGMQILEEEKVKEIEEMTATLNPLPDRVKMKVKPRLLFRPLADQGTLVPDPDADFQLYDRVVVVKTGYSVPFGQRGTIIGIPKMEDGGLSPNSLFDIVFDKAFVGGITLRCSPGRGYRVPGSAMLNLTFGEFRKQVGPSTSIDSSKPLAGMYNNNNLSQQRWQRGPAPPSSSSKAWQTHAQQQQQQQQTSNQAFNQKPVKWDSRGQPLFGKIFTGQNEMKARAGGPPPQQQQQQLPQFVTPKLEGQQSMIGTRKVAQTNSRQIDNTEFDNMWKNLQSHQISKPGSSSSSSGAVPVPTDILKQVASVLPQPPASTTAGTGPHMVLAHPPDNSASPRLLHHPIAQRLSQPAGARDSTLSGSGSADAASTINTAFTSSSITSPSSSLNREPAAVTLLQKQISVPGDNAGDPSSSTSAASVPASVQNLFDKAKLQQQQQHQHQQQQTMSKAEPSPENSEFLAMFNSLKTQNAETVRVNRDSSKIVPAATEAVAEQVNPATPEVPALKEKSPKSQADLALKQLLKIGVGGGDSSSSVAGPEVKPIVIMGQESPRSHESESGGGGSAATAYGRQVSLQALFEEANRQQQKQQQQQQQQQQHQQPNVHQAYPAAANVQASKSRDPIAELEGFCQAAFQKGDIHFDYKSQPKQHGFIATVSLPNGQKFEGSLCEMKPDSAKSAASMALLCLRSPANATHPVITGFAPRAGQGQRASGINRFFSPNSAFSPIGLPGPSLLPHGVRSTGPPPAATQAPPPLLLTPQHFINQPPPSMPLHQLLQQQQQQQHQQQQHQQQQHHPSNSQGYSLMAQLQQPPPPPPPPTTASATTSRSQVSPMGAVISPPSPSSSTGTAAVAAATTSGRQGTNPQQFIPFQVTKQRKKKEAEDGLASVSTGSAPDSSFSKSKGTGSAASSSEGTAQTVPEASGGGLASPVVTVENKLDISDLKVVPAIQVVATNISTATVQSPGASAAGLPGLKDAAAQPASSPSTLQTGSETKAGKQEISIPKEGTTAPVTKPVKKKKSRLAANFGKKS